MRPKISSLKKKSIPYRESYYEKHEILRDMLIL